MRFALICACLLAILAAAGCELLNATGSSGGKRPGEKITLLPDDDIPADAARVTDIGLEGDVLRLEVAFGGGCREHLFGLHFSKGIVKTYPPGVEVYLSHLSNGDMCEALITRELFFDLVPLKRFLLATYPKDEVFRINVHEPRGQGAFERIEMRSPWYDL